MKTFEGRRLVIATKHGKEKVLGPLLESVLGVECLILPEFDTDQFGTFSGEVSRVDDPLTTAKKKAQLAMEISGCDMAVASEGSFGPHPTLYFTAADEELLLLVDKKLDLEIAVRQLSTDTNYSSVTVTTWEELLDFAKKVGFPSHALILRRSHDDLTTVKKGITDIIELKEYFMELRARYPRVCVETDMRAHHNPSRMAVIEQAGRKLTEVVIVKCPNCSNPGFGLIDVTSGLVCSLCGTPTASIKSHVYGCKKCGHTDERMFPFDKKQEDPMFCDVCNP